MGAIFIAGQAGWYLVVERWWHFRRKQCSVADLLAMLETDPHVDPDMLEKKLLSDRRLRGVFAEVVPGSWRSPVPTAAKSWCATRVRLCTCQCRLNRHLGTIAVLAAAAPLLGLTGTVNGIMATFRVMTLYGVGTLP